MARLENMDELSLIAHEKEMKAKWKASGNSYYLDEFCAAMARIGQISGR